MSAPGRLQTGCRLLHLRRAVEFAPCVGPLREQETPEGRLNPPRPLLALQQPDPALPPPERLLNQDTMTVSQHVVGPALNEHPRQALQLRNSKLQSAPKATASNTHPYKSLNLRRRFLPAPVLAQLPEAPGLAILHELSVPLRLRPPRGDDPPEHALNRHGRPPLQKDGVLRPEVPLGHPADVRRCVCLPLQAVPSQLVPGRRGDMGC
mmetsp:Transcript_24536/g.62426  ORF Transcript_24536/g.62426 Transcript_24536/m.62426 type:complete len:208 (+) Transcript_24536:2325-2948(+)